VHLDVVSTITVCLVSFYDLSHPFDLFSFLVDKMPGKYDEYDWDELPEDIQKAAILLGFDKEIWDTDDEPSDCDEYWKDLTPAQQEAATKLGYNEEMWNKE
jgi:hypothetical protein